MGKASLYVPAFGGFVPLIGLVVEGLSALLGQDIAMAECDQTFKVGEKPGEGMFACLCCRGEKIETPGSLNIFDENTQLPECKQCSAGPNTVWKCVIGKAQICWGTEKPPN